MASGFLLRGYGSDAVLTAPVLVLAATSARMLVQSARRGGFRPIALDLFGDLDTRGAAHWISISHPRRKEIDVQRLEAALSRLARFPRILGWVAGGGLEHQPDAMSQCGQALSMIGNGAATVADTKDPAIFFDLLDRYGIEHPEIRLDPPPVATGWLSKKIGGTGGWHVRRVSAGQDEQSDEDVPAEDVPAEDAPLTDAPFTDAPFTDVSADDASVSGDPSGPVPQRPPSRSPPRVRYYQRELHGKSMSALFLSNGSRVSLVGFNRLLVAPLGECPFVFQGAVGPVELPAGPAQAVRRAVEKIVQHAGLVGLNSMDFLMSERGVSVLEVNPRPSATLALHDDRLRGGLMAAHVAACLHGLLPDESAARMIPVRGLQVIYARRSLLANQRGRVRLQALGWCHDIAPAGTRTGSGEPLCTVSASGGSENEVIARLAQRAVEVERVHEEEDDE